MTQPSLLDAVEYDAKTYTANVARFFRANVGRWVRATELEAVGGRQAWRTRVSEARRVYGLTIENRVRRVREADGRTWTLSEYRFTDGSPA
jgi:hypothetical protein